MISSILKEEEEAEERAEAYEDMKKNKRRKLAIGVEAQTASVNWVLVGTLNVFSGR